MKDKEKGEEEDAKEEGPAHTLGRFSTVGAYQEVIITGSHASSSPTGADVSY